MIWYFIENIWKSSHLIIREQMAGTNHLIKVNKNCNLSVYTNKIKEEVYYNNSILSNRI